MLKHEICYNVKTTKTTCEAKPLREIPMNQASFFVQVATEAVVSKAAYDRVEYEQDWNLKGACNDKAKVSNCDVYFDKWVKDVQDHNGPKSDFYVRSTDGTLNVETWKVSHDTDALGNATELTIAKAKSGVSITNDSALSTSTTSIDIINDASMSKTNALGNHPSTISYGFTVSKLDKAETEALDTTWMTPRTTATEKPLAIWSIKYAPSLIRVSEAGKTTVDATTSLFSNTSQGIDIITVGSISSDSSGETETETWITNM